MKQLKAGEAEYKAHIKALEEHKALLDLMGETNQNIDMEEVKRSLQNLVLTVEEYFKVIGIP